MNHNFEVVRNLTITQNLNTSAVWTYSSTSIPSEVTHIVVNSIIVNGDATVKDEHIYMIQTDLPISDPNKIIGSFAGLNTVPTVSNPKTLIKLQSVMPPQITFSIMADSIGAGVATVPDTKLSICMDLLKLL